MRWWISIGAVLIAGALAGGDVAGLAAPGPKHHLADKDQAATVDVELILQRLDRLTQDEARATAAQVLEVIHGLVQGMKVIMCGE